VLAGTPIVVSAAFGNERAGVRRDGDGHLWIAHWTAERPDRVAGTRLESLRVAHISGPGWVAVGGRLATAARSVDVRDDDATWRPATVGGGAWVAFARSEREDGRPPPLRMSDAEGALVFRGEPEWAAAARRLQADERLAVTAGRDPTCPACGADDWRAAPADGGHGEYVFCAVCGHNDGSISAFFSATRSG
jgi:hypothetical protein